MALSIQLLLLGELLLRRVLYIFVPVRRTSVQRFADNSVMGALVAACMQTATLPLQALGGLLSIFSRSVAVVLLGMLLVTTLMVLSTSSVYMYSTLTNIYNTGIAPVVGCLRWLFVLMDFIFRATVPLWNGWTYMLSQILQKLVVPYSYTNKEVLPEMLQALTLFVTALGQSFLSWLQHVQECTLSYQDKTRVCGSNDLPQVSQDCSSVFTIYDLQCFATPNYLSVDLLTPGLFARQAAMALQRGFANSCGIAAVVLNLLLFPLCDQHLYMALHAAVNTVLFTCIGMPIGTWRRCAALEKMQDLLPVHKSVGCTPDWQPVAALTNTALARTGDVINNWLNAAALIAHEEILGSSRTCAKLTKVSDVVLDAARAIEGLESVEALMRLQSKNGMPESETLQKVRVIGLTPHLFGVSDGKSVLYRSPHDGYVLAFGAWPFAVDVRFGLAAVTYGGSLSDADYTGDARTGLLGCKCVDEPEFSLLCATAPYVQHIDDELAGLNASSVHKVTFAGLNLAGLTCKFTQIRVIPLRWSRRRMATAESNGGSGYAGYQRFSYTQDATDNLRVLANVHRALPSGAVEAAIYVQPVCGYTKDASVSCAVTDKLNCYPWCMGVVRGGRRAQNVTMYNQGRWDEHVIMPDVDCVVRKHSKCQSGIAGISSFVDIMAQIGVVEGSCGAEVCTPHPVPAAVMSLLPLAAISGGKNSTIGLIQNHKNVWLGVRSEKQPFVVAGDVMLHCENCNSDNARIVVTRLYDIGQGTLQVASERLTLISNAKAVRVATCATAADTKCVAQAMQSGAVVLPNMVREIRASGVAETNFLPQSAASRWAVHWADNPEISVFNAVFEFCNNHSFFGLMQLSSFGRARVWSMQTMRSIDMEQEGEPSLEQEQSRVSYMRVPSFINSAQMLHDPNTCQNVMGLRVEGVEYLNEHNVLVTVMAARPADYDPATGTVKNGAPRTHRYYYLNPARHDCYRTDDEDELEDDPAIFSCWRTQSFGMWEEEDVVKGPMTQKNKDPCAGPLLVPVFGSAMVMPLIFFVHVLEMTLDVICTLPALMAARPQDPGLAMEELFTLELRHSAFHGMVDSAGARLFQVDDIIRASIWLNSFFAQLMVYVVNGIASGAQGLNLPPDADKSIRGLRTLVVGGAKVYEGLPRTDKRMAAVEQMFQEPITTVGHSASMAVLTIADNLYEETSMNPIVGMFIKTQLSMASTLEMTLRLGRVVLLRLVQTIGAAARDNEASALSLVTSAVLESREIVQSSWLDLMRFQCYGLVQAMGSTQPWGQAVRNLCLLAPDTFEGLMTVSMVLLLEYPMVSCACKLGEGDILGSIEDMCIRRPLPVESTQWMIQLRMSEASQQQMCFAAMDSANARLHDAFDKSFKRLYEMTRHAAQVVDGLLALVTGDIVACDAFDVSPYVLSIVPEPVDYFMSCMHTDDCETRCLDEFQAFEKKKQEMLNENPPLRPKLTSTLKIPLESMLFSQTDIEEGLSRPPFLSLDIVELSERGCRQVCSRQGSVNVRNRCVVTTGLLESDGRTEELAVAYYCLPIDITQYAYQWPSMQVSEQPAAGPMGFAVLENSLRALFIATTWAAQFGSRDSLIALVQDSFTLAGAENEIVTKVLWFVPTLPARELFRTSMRIERDLRLDEPNVLHMGYLSSIEHIEVDSTDVISRPVRFLVYGYRLEKKVVNQESSIYAWKLPEKVCIECHFNSNLQDFQGVTCQLQCPPSLSNDVDVQTFAQTHLTVCMRLQEDLETTKCNEKLWLPRGAGKSPNALAQEELMEKPTVVYMQMQDNEQLFFHKLNVPPSTFNVFRSYGAYMDMQQRVHARVVLVSRVIYLDFSVLQELRIAVKEQSTDINVALEILLVNGGAVQGAWMQMLQLRLADNVGASETNWMRTETIATYVMDCTIQTCGACAYADDVPRQSLQQLENLCYAAQQCGIERCAGTLVNMRKPLCNLGNVLVGEMHSIRVLLTGMWSAVTDNIIMIVELTHNRRREYEIKWPQELVLKQSCTAKDTIVSTAASITSIFGAFSHLMTDVSVHHGLVGSHVDSRVHARYIMILTATTNLLSSVMMWPIYQGLVLQKFLVCTANDISYVIENLISAPGEQRTMSIHFGRTQQQNAIENAQIAVCLSEDVQQSLRDSGVRARSPDTAQNTFSRDARAVTSKISEAIANSVDMYFSTYIQFATHFLDIWLTWGSSVLRGMMDVAQTVDWQNCKLPVIDTGLQSLGLCACGDLAYTIPAADKIQDWTQQAFWCSGWLMLNEGDGSDQLVWNPYSLQQLLSFGPDDHSPSATSHGHGEYLTCLRERWNSGSTYYQSSCESLKPKNNILQKQGVEVMQVISRCRANYQQSRWDEAAVLYGLFTAEEWTDQENIRNSASAKQDDKFSMLRKQVVRLLENTGTQKLVLPLETWQCLHDALNAGAMRHNCHRMVSKFEYTRTKDNTPWDIDACKVSQTTGLDFPRFLWSGSSSNHVPLAKLHAEQLDPEQRQAYAENRLNKLMQEHIKPAFDMMLSQKFMEKLKKDLYTEAFSVEGDELHQLIDCVILGPYSSADLSSNVHLDNVQPLPVPQYHRGKKDSRKFAGGSQARKDLMKMVFEFVSEKAESVTSNATELHLQKLAQTWLNPENFQCICDTQQRDWKCCTGQHNSVLLDVSSSETEWDIAGTILKNTLHMVATSTFLRETLYTTFWGSQIQLTNEHRSYLQEAHLFAHAMPVETYSAADTEDALNKNSLWETCTSKVAGLFSTMPFTAPEVNQFQNRGHDKSVLDIPVKRVEEYDPVEDHDPSRGHSMEMLVDALLERSRTLTPHFWTHAHRYVPTDSVWCENGSSALFEQPKTARVFQTPTHLESLDENDSRLRSVSLDAPEQADLLYPAQVLKSCACGWWKNGCYIPQSVCDSTTQAASDEQTLWNKLCASKHYNTTRELLLVLRVLRALPAKTLEHENCSSRRPSLAWGLLSPADQENWYAGEMQNWSFDTQNLASTGPAGLRLGMLSPAENVRLEEYLQSFKLGEDLRETFNAKYEHTIGQPVCEGTLHTHTPDDLRQYFLNTFVPMAHAVQIVPAVEYCSRWVLEYAMLAVLQKAAEAEFPDMLKKMSQQQESVHHWRGRCAAQMHEVGLCALRGVYDITPSDKSKPPNHCAFAGHTISDCRAFYYTSSCLLYCDGHFYDPCLCATQASGCKPRDFSPGACSEGLLVDGRSLLQYTTDETLLTSSLHWPMEIDSTEAVNDTHWLSLQVSLQATRSVSKLQDVNFQSLFNLTKAVLLARPDKESIPHAYCDDLFDYWPDVQHPVGYHPTTACSAQDTNTRGFDAWMSRDDSGTTLLDPVRTRNMTQASRVFGASHLVCDAHAYAAPGHALNPYYMQSKWDPFAQADPAVPMHPPAVDQQEMSMVGDPSYDDSDTAMRTEGHSGDAILRHSVGLVRAWARWFVDEKSWKNEQGTLDTVWPHWLPDESNKANAKLENSGLFLAGTRQQPAGCALPSIMRCRNDEDCQQEATGLECLLNFNEEPNSRRGVCMSPNTCYQHKHCETQKMLCSGEGKCVQPKIFVTTSAAWDSEVQMFGKDCDTSMQRMSRFESVADYAQANGMCSFRNWYHYLNSTYDAQTIGRIKQVSGHKEVFRTNKKGFSTLEELGVLKTYPHACDRSYTHTNFKACTTLQATLGVSKKPALSFTAAQTWKNTNGSWHVQFCNMPSTKASGFLHPYGKDTLKTARQDIRRCIEYNLCPATQFHVLGEAVENRRVQVQVLRVDALHGVHAEPSAREYCNLDAQKCWAMGYLLGKNCEQLAEDNSMLCVVDMLVLPFFRIVYATEQGNFPENYNQFRDRLTELRKTCQQAFVDDVKTENGELEYFIKIYEYLSQPYTWTDFPRRALVAEYANSLLWLVFGKKRGFDNLSQYLRHSQCAAFLAQRLAQAERVFDVSTSTGFEYYASSREDAVLPGSSLYLIDHRFPVHINLRWLMQCVILASSEKEGGVRSDFEKLLVQGISKNMKTLPCTNYMDITTVKDTTVTTMSLKNRLATATFLFTQTDTAQPINPNQFIADIQTSVARALSALGVFDMPDLVCVSTSAVNGWQDLMTNNQFDRIVGVSDTHLHRFSLPGLSFKDAQVASQIFASSGNISIYKQVLEFLLHETYATWDWDDQESFDNHYIQDLIDLKVLKEVTTDLNQIVPLMDRYPRYSYKNMDKLANLFHSFTESPTNYLNEPMDFCSCTQEEKSEDTKDKDDINVCSTRKRLVKPEYRWQAWQNVIDKEQIKCESFQGMPCSAEGVKELMNRRKNLDPPFLLQDELLYLVLLIFQYEISYTASGGFTTLHKIIDRQQAQFVTDMYTNVKLPNNQNTIQLQEAQDFNRFLDRHDALNLKCQTTGLNYNAETSEMHMQMKDCKNDLEKPLGWKLPKDEFLTLTPDRATLFEGFYVSYSQEPTEKTFLDTLTDTLWHKSEFSSPEKAICHSDEQYDGNPRVMAPFWGEYFDVASNMGDTAQDPAKACDFERSSTSSIIMVYNTLCETSIDNLQSCQNHPGYKWHLQNTLPDDCTRDDGHVVVRRHLGALNDEHLPLCDRRPSFPNTCHLKHGTLNGRTGTAVHDLTNIELVLETTSGFWETAFRKQEQLGLSNVRALALHENDIAGHCLHFHISDQGILSLRNAFLASKCSPDHNTGQIQNWLATVEKDWEWEHLQIAALNVVPKQASSPWTCPLHWLQQYHDDNTRYQARSPSWQRNSARFEHITRQHKYAHPTVPQAAKIRGVRAPRFISDAMACVAAAKDCHGKNYLHQTLTNLLTPGTWQTVQYVPEKHTECLRVLDWPEDCGSFRPLTSTTSSQGRCSLRQ